MEPVLTSCGGCGVKIRIIRPEVLRERPCPRCGTPIEAIPAAPGAEAAGAISLGEGDEAESPMPARRPVRLAAEAGLLLALFTTLLLRLGEVPDSRASSVAGVPLSAAESRPCAIATAPAPAASRPGPAGFVAPTDALALPTDGPPAPCHEPTEELANEDDDRPDPPAAADPKAEAAAKDAAAIVAEGPEPRRIRVRTRSGKTVAARVHGEANGEVHILLPDGQLGIPDRAAFTGLPFVPATADEMAEELLGGPFQGFRLHRTPNYLIVYQCDAEFAEESGRVLENLYRGLTEAFRKFKVPVHDAEFPLVAVIFADEAAFRAHRDVAAEVRAYYEIYSNRIYFYQTSERDEDPPAPEVAALQRPQTVAHEGTHQILANIGIQPRLAAWPPWLTEGLAEYCATPQTTRKGTTWAGLGLVNPLHLATIRDLDDPLSGQVAGTIRPEPIGRKPGMPLVEYLVRKAELTPTDYALSWAMTHYLAKRRVDDFVGFLRAMSRLRPLEPRSPDDHLAAFRAAFGEDLVKLDREIGSYLLKLKANNHLPHYAVMVERRLGAGMMHRAAIVSQSPSMIREWLERLGTARDDLSYWQAVPFPNRAPARAMAEAWVRP